MSRPGKKITRKRINMTNKMNELSLKERACKNMLANVLDMEDDHRHIAAGNNGAFAKINGTKAPETGSIWPSAEKVGFPQTHPLGKPSISAVSGTCSATTRELKNILKEMRFMTGKLKEKDDENETESDWKFAAMVIDRFCLIIFTTFTIVTTVAVLFSAPHILVE